MRRYRSSNECSIRTCTPVRDYIRIRTPFLYPDGDVVDLYWRDNLDGHGATITDLGESLRWLRMQSTSGRRTVKQNQIIADVQMTHNVEFFKGMLLARAGSDADIAEVVHRVAQAALRVSDIWFTFRLRSVESIGSEIEEFLSERRIAYDPGVRIPGRSARIWNVDFRTRTEHKSALINVLSTWLEPGGQRGVSQSMLLRPGMT